MRDYRNIRTVDGALAASTRSFGQAIAPAALVASLLLGGMPAGCSRADRGKQPADNTRTREAVAPKAKSDPRTGPPKELTLDLGKNVTMKLVLIPAGRFLMGSPDNEYENDPRNEERPQRELTISEPFYMGVYEVTVTQFAAFISDTGYTTDAEKKGWAYAWDGRSIANVSGASWRKPGFAQGDEHPVVCISQNDAVAYCTWLSGKTGKRVGLPTEAQWEYACRAGTTTAYPRGDKPGDGEGWCNGLDLTTGKHLSVGAAYNWEDGYAFTAPVGRFKPNGFGLYDVIGNV